METPPTEGLHELLTEEEKLVLQLLAGGRATKEIAAVLEVSPEETRARVNIIFEKLQVHSRVGPRNDPPPLPPAASAALPVPFERAEDIPRPRRWASASEAVSRSRLV